ncbi:hypothetical protein RSOLAG1IB_05858 [Rhizoctonia solani AG-1 IB]|uniref:Uncharacterized protein n=1 Tax=Thanatephorus cucumeris (strain AG1-IB / isolate 7/3/14) TaxID=1108050 RepID=A0A0B7F8Y3_THACB|nr:hypothetical protein RSOLAG1IB_05858 [Rhizoctonia solani AG-1 IB]
MRYLTEGGGSRSRESVVRHSKLVERNGVPCARIVSILAFFSTFPPSLGTYGFFLWHFEWFSATSGLRSGRSQPWVVRPTPLDCLRAAPGSPITAC